MGGLCILAVTLVVLESTCHGFLMHGEGGVVLWLLPEDVFDCAVIRRPHDGCLHLLVSLRCARRCNPRYLEAHAGGSVPCGFGSEVVVLCGNPVHLCSFHIAQVHAGVCPSRLWWPMSRLSPGGGPQVLLCGAPLEGLR